MLIKTESSRRAARRTSFESIDKPRSVFAVHIVKKTPHPFVCMKIDNMQESFRAITQVGEWRWDPGEVYCVNAAKFPAETLNTISLRSKFFQRPDLPASPGWTRRCSWSNVSHRFDSLPVTLSKGNSNLYMALTNRPDPPERVSGRFAQPEVATAFDRLRASTITYLHLALGIWALVSLWFRSICPRFLVCVSGLVVVWLPRLGYCPALELAPWSQHWSCP